MPQDVEFSAGTVADNIARLGEVDSHKAVQAAQRAHVHKMILALPEGYDTPVDPAGILISPGQRQRSALARTLYGEPKLMVLDEPNSNLDRSGDMALTQTLRDLREEVTVVVVKHRNSMIGQPDKLLALEGARVTQYGMANEVLQALQQRGPGTPVGGPVVVPCSAAPRRLAGSNFGGDKQRWRRSSHAKPRRARCAHI